MTTTQTTDLNPIVQQNGNFNNSNDVTNSKNFEQATQNQTKEINNSTPAVSPSKNPTTFNIEKTPQNQVIMQNTGTYEKQKRHRRGKETQDERIHKCEECNKSYLSAPALIAHKKTKHGFVIEGEKKGRGRPRKDNINNNASINNSKKKYENFFNNDLRKNKNLDSNLNEINEENLKTFFNDIFKQLKETLFKDLKTIEEYNFYDVVVKNWDNKDFQIENHSLNSIQNDNKESNNPTLDQTFFLYLKEIKNQTNKEYFWFVFKFIITFRECLNTIKKESVKDSDKNYTQIYNAESVPDVCNDYFVNFMEPNKFFGLNTEELIEVIQHFCYWLYEKNFTQSHLTLL